MNKTKKLVTFYNYTIPLDTQQENGCDKICTLLQEPDAQPQEIEELSKQYNIPLNFNINEDQKLLEMIFMDHPEFFKANICDLLLDKGNYTEKELKAYFKKSFLQKKFTRYELKKKIFEWFVSKNIELPHSYHYNHAKRKYEKFSWQRIIKEYIFDLKFSRYDFIYKFIEQNYDIMEVSSNGDSIFHYLASSYSNNIMAPHSYSNKRYVIEFLKYFDSKSPKYVFSKVPPLQNKNNQTMYHILFSNLSLSKYENNHFKTFEYLLKYHDINNENCVFNLKDKWGKTVMDIICDKFINYNHQSATMKSNVKKLLNIFKYDFTKDSHKMKELL